MSSPYLNTRFGNDAVSLSASASTLRFTAYILSQHGNMTDSARSIRILVTNHHNLSNSTGRPSTQSWCFDMDDLSVDQWRSIDPQTSPSGSMVAQQHGLLVVDLDLPLELLVTSTGQPPKPHTSATGGWPHLQCRSAMGEDLLVPQQDH